MKLLLTSLALFLVHFSSLAANYYVNDASNAYDIFTTGTGNNANPGTAALPFATLDHVINVVGLVPGDVVYVDAGYYYQTDANLLLNVNNISIIGAGNDVTIFDNDQGSVDSNKWATITGDGIIIQDLMITGYNYGLGGASAIEITGVAGLQIINVLTDENKPGGGASSIVISGGSQVDFTGGGANCNTAASVAGGGVNVEGAGNTVTFTNYSFSNNSKSWQGGSGLYIAGTNTTNVFVTNSIFADNTNSSASGGAAIFITGSNLTIDSSCFIDNTYIYTFGPAYGGAISVGRGATVSIANCTFTGNSASTSGNGGAISINTSFAGSGAAAVVSIDTCTFSGNTASNEGNDLYARVGFGNPATFNVNQCTFSGTVEDIREDNTATINIQNSGTPTATGAGINFINTTPSSAVPVTNCPVLVGSCYVAPCTNPTPTGNSPQDVCDSPLPTIADIVVSGGPVIVWYDLPSGGTAYYPTDLLVDGQTYYAVDETIGCDPSSALAVTVNFVSQPDAGTNGSVLICEGTVLTAPVLFGQLGGSPEPGGVWTPALAGAGVYTYTVDGTPCADATATVTVTAQPQPDAGTNGSLTICAGSTVTAGQLLAQLGGTPDLTGTWSPALAGAGIYTYTVAPTSPCTIAATATVTVTAQAQPNAGTNGVLTICAGSTVTTGQLFAQLGGSPQAGGVWTPILAGAGIYTYTVAPTSPCTIAATATVTVTAQAQPNAGTNGVLTICAGSIVTAGQLLAQLGGTPDLTGTWSPALAGAGLYTYTVAATSPCTVAATATVTVTAQAQPNAGTNGVLTICAGSTVTTGQLFAELGGTPDLGGTWSPLLAGAGVYTYTVAATSPCTIGATANITVSESDTLAPTGAAMQQFCLSDSPTVSDISVTGNNIQWYSDPLLSIPVSGAVLLQNGSTYYATQTNSLGCESTTALAVTVTLSNPQLNSTNMIVTESACGQANGSVIGVTVSGGLPNYSWSWTNGGVEVATTQDLLNQNSGIYTVTVTDNIGCTDVLAGIIINDAGAPTINVSAMVIQAETCDGTNGSISGITVTGGTGSLNYSWTGPNAFSSSSISINSLESGDYTLTVTDDNGCSSSAGPFTIQNLVGPSIDTTSLITVDAQCGLSNGSITGIVATGGNGNLTYSWSDGVSNVGNTLNLNNLNPGTYTLTISDTNNCIDTVTVAVLSDPPGTVEAVDDNASTAYETPVTFNIYNNDIGDVTTITVTSPPTNGTVVVGAAGNVTYTPNAGFSGTDSFLYQICDENCSLLCETALVTIIVGEPIDVNIPNGYSPNGDGYNDEFVIVGLEFYPNNSIIIFNRWGDMVFEAEPYLNDWDGTTTNSALKIIGNQVTDGTYYFILKLDAEDSDDEAIPGFIDLRRN